MQLSLSKSSTKNMTNTHPLDWQKKLYEEVALFEECEKNNFEDYVFINRNQIEEYILLLQNLEKKQIDAETIFNKCDCEFDSQIAYVIKKDGETPTHIILIEDYLKNKKMQQKVKGKDYLIVCQKGNELISYESAKRKCHFKHKNLGDNEMTKWHKDWQNMFPDSATEITIGNRRADAIIKNESRVIEFQHSYISLENVNLRTKDYNNHDFQVYWILECLDNLVVEQNKDHYDITFATDFWKYKNFVDQKFIYLDNENRIFKINPNDFKNNTISVRNYKTADEFMDYLKGNNDWEYEHIKQGIIYFNQRGAGCGKTYESIQLLQDNDKFRDKNVFIYLTKVHSAKQVIYSELKEQQQKGKLGQIEFDTVDENGKQIKIECHTSTKEIEIIIGTIDSFAWAIGNKNHDDGDFFRGLIRSIKDGCINMTRRGGIKYAQNIVTLDKKCLIIIDEAQDLEPMYIESFDTIVKKTGIDIYVIGDKLQSITNEINIHTTVEKNSKNEIALDSKIESNRGINNVRRFHNAQFINFVNSIVPFQKWDLPPIESICDGDCKYKHEDNKKPYNIFQIPMIYNHDFDSTKVNKFIKDILFKMKNEVNIYNYLPKNFMFIFPFISKNYVASQLEIAVQKFWIKKFKNLQYRKILSKDEHWKDKLDQKFHKYVYLHKSEEGRPINLNESEHATRFVSIHTSKGNGCEVIFVLGLSEFTLTKFSKQTDNLVYNSLLHVALTRQKKSIYVGIVNNGDEVCERFSKYLKIDPSIQPILSGFSKSIKINEIVSYVVDTDSFKIFNLKIIKPSDYIKQIPKINNKKQLIDWGHHILRYNMFFYHVLKNIIESEIMDDDDDIQAQRLTKSQFKTVINKISNLKIKKCSYTKYYELLNEISNKQQYSRLCRMFGADPVTIDNIPILLFEKYEKSFYYRYCDILKEYMENIQQKFLTRKNENTYPDLCSMETLILLHMWSVMDNGKYTTISIMDVYSIMYIFDECSHDIMTTHETNCSCKKFFNAETSSTNSYPEIRNSIRHHYDKIDYIKKIITNFKQQLKIKYPEAKFVYNTFYFFCFRSGKKGKINFNLNHEYPIIAYSEKYVIFFILKPQFNKLNFNEIMLEIIFHQYLLSKCDNKKFSGKQVLACLLTLDSSAALFFEFPIEKVTNEIIDSIKTYIMTRSERYYKILYELYTYCKINKPKNKTSLDFMCEKIEEYQDKCSANQRLPEYIIAFFYSLNMQYHKAIQCGKSCDDIKAIFQSKETFIEEINIHTKIALDNYLNITNEDEYVDDDF